MKVLWLCNIVLPDFSGEFGIKKNPAGGWMTGMLHELEKMEEVDISLCFPIFDPQRKKDGACNGHMYYTFLCRDVETYDAEMVGVFERILEKASPDIIHIWGTEYPHTTAMVTACRNRGMLDKTVINIQGLISVYAKHYLADIPEKYLKLEVEGHKSIKEAQASFEQRGKYEIESLKMARHVIGRTDWDEACVKAINPQIRYHVCDEILRESFYENAGRWKYENCQQHSIFVSQASYPIKGFHYLLQALPIIRSQYPDIHVYVAGTDILKTEKKDSYSIYIEDLIEKLKLKENISFLGKLEEGEMVEEYYKANVFVLASTIENSPNSLNEAMIMGIPSIASYVGGICNRMTSGMEGILYPYNEPDLLAYYICKFFENKDNLCGEISSRAVEKILKVTDPKENAKKNLNIYKILLSHKLHA